MRRNVTDILCIGAQRAMTTWLHQVLQAHPDVWNFPDFSPLTSTNKEAHFWDWNHARGETWYRVLMRPLDESRKSADITPEYAFLNPSQIAQCHRLSPDARVIYLLRDPLARAISALRMRTIWATNNAPADSLTLTLNRDFLDRCTNAQLWLHGDYAANLRRWRARYPDMLVLNVEDIQADPTGSIQRILAHCGLSAPDATTAAQIDARAARRVWQTPAYALADDCLDFLDGLTWQARRAIADEGFVFHESARLHRGQG